MNILMTGTCRILEMSLSSTVLVVRRLIRVRRHINHRSFSSQSDDYALFRTYGLPS